MGNKTDLHVSFLYFFYLYAIILLISVAKQFDNIDITAR
jgi:hypothetical protein